MQNRGHSQDFKLTVKFYFWYDKKFVKSVKNFDTGSVNMCVIMTKNYARSKLVCSTTLLDDFVWYQGICQSNQNIYIVSAKNVTPNLSK